MMTGAICRLGGRSRPEGRHAPSGSRYQGNVNQPRYGCNERFDAHALDVFSRSHHTKVVG
jgi:hypothetical protein